MACSISIQYYWLKVLLGLLVIVGLSLNTINVVFLHVHQIKGSGNKPEQIIIEEKGYTVLANFLDHAGQCESIRVSRSLDGAIPNLNIGKGRYDDKRLLRIYDFHYTGNDWESLISRYDVCFTTQTSIERLYWLPEILEHWNGPVSIAVQILGEREFLILNLFMCYLSHCHTDFRNQIALHLAVPTNISTPFMLRDEMLRQWNLADIAEIYERGAKCPGAKEYLAFLMDTFPPLDTESLKLKEVYPQSHMRNIARKACGTPWTMAADIDIIPRAGMAEMLQEFYENQKDEACEKCAFVIPTFELDETFPFPRSKAEIIKHFENGTARQFHGKVYASGHRATDYQRWTTTNVDDEPVKISHAVDEKKIYDYEPFYVSPDVIPPYDERFLGYGFTRNSQFKAAFEAGWNFSVLTPVFSVHWGLQTQSTRFSPKKNGVGKNVRVEQTHRNYKIYQKVKKELALKKELGLF